MPKIKTINKNHIEIFKKKRKIFLKNLVFSNFRTLNLKCFDVFACTRARSKKLRKTCASNLKATLHLNLFPKLSKTGVHGCYHFCIWLLSSIAPTKLAVLELDHATPAAKWIDFIADHCNVVIARLLNQVEIAYLHPWHRLKQKKCVHTPSCRWRPLISISGFLSKEV